MRAARLRSNRDHPSGVKMLAGRDNGLPAWSAGAARNPHESDRHNISGGQGLTGGMFVCCIPITPASILDPPKPLYDPIVSFGCFHIDCVGKHVRRVHGGRTNPRRPVDI